MVDEVAALRERADAWSGTIPDEGIHDLDAAIAVCQEARTLLYDVHDQLEYGAHQHGKTLRDAVACSLAQLNSALSDIPVYTGSEITSITARLRVVRAVLQHTLSEMAEGAENESGTSRGV